MALVPVRRKPGFREKFLYYLKINADPKLSLKLMQVSSYFCFREFPYFVVRNLVQWSNTKWQYVPLEHSGEIICYDFDGEIIDDNKKHLAKYGGIAHIGRIDDGLQDIDLDVLRKPLWIINKYESCSSTPTVSKLIPKIAVCELKELKLYDQTLTWNELEFLVSSKTIEDFGCGEVQVKYPDDSIVPIDEVAKLLPNLTIFHWSSYDMPFPHLTAESTKNLIEHLNPSTLTYFGLRGLSDVFDFNLFSKFIDENPLIEFYLAFNILAISRDYNAMIQAYERKLKETGKSEKCEIMIYTPV